ncbi:pimeloyl-ACP methyl ester carboxylesterase [Rhodovulum iodosum]|uniref:Pimeloyl-ACP methyl ester carboxylesterase n=1 Tax=Rhodovulum iodosum TaxID=68291 RepID=A0ABV3XST5_9RHOB|nr:alpha/beta hydrolase [Rhodovulum robiginosum]RSK31289.1 alpha/beta hydrolase [Rhodovulum robiginosum]
MPLPPPVPVRVGGQEIATRVMGEGPPLVLIHGTPFSSHVWHRIAPVLAVRHRVYLYDLLGYGASAKPAGDVSLGVQNGVLAALFAHWQLDAPGVIAHDFGGATALRAHLLDGLDYDRLLLIDPVALRPWGSAFVAHVKRHEAAFAGVPDYMQRALLAAYIRTSSHAGLTDAALDPYIAPWLGAEGQPAFYRQIAQMDMAYTDEVEPGYPGLRCPVRLIWGQEDQWIPLAAGERLAAMLPGCRLVRVPGAGHLVQEDAPEAILAEALDMFG